MAVMGLGHHTLPGDEPRAQEPFLCLIQAVITACFVHVYMQYQDFSLTGCEVNALWVQTILPKPMCCCLCCHLQRPNHEATLKVTQPRTTGTDSQSLTFHQ